MKVILGVLVSHGYITTSNIQQAYGEPRLIASAVLYFVALPIVVIAQWALKIMRSWIYG